MILNSSRNTLNAIAVLALMIFCTISYLSYVQVNNLYNATERVNHTHEVIKKADNIFINLFDLESIQRGYLLTGKEEYLTLYEQNLKEVNDNLEKLRSLTHQNINQQKKIKELQPILKARTDLLQEVIQIYRYGERDKAFKLINSGKGKILTDQIKQKGLEIIDEEKLLLEKRSAIAKQNERKTNLFILFGTMIGNILLILSLIVLNFQMRYRLKADRDLGKSLSLLKATLESTADGILVIDRKGKIESYNQKFCQMWRIPSRVMETSNGKKTLKALLKEIKDPHRFIEKVKEFYRKPEAEYHDEIESSDGKIFESYTIPQRLKNEIIGRVFSFRDITERKNMEKQMIHQATHDPLTQLPNKTLLKDRLTQGINQAKRDKTIVAVLFFDLDQFKTINDTLGHDIGDILLQEVSTRIQSCIRQSDTLARWGGDEFIMVLPSQTRGSSYPCHQIMPTGFR